MADDLDWNAIIAPGDAERRGTDPSDGATAPTDRDQPRATRGRDDRPLSRREARAREAALRRDSGSVADAPVASSAEDLHPEVHALLGGHGDHDDRPREASRPAARRRGEEVAPDDRGEPARAATRGATATAGGAAGVGERTDHDDHDREDAGDSVGAGGGRGGRDGRRGGGRASRPPRRRRSRGALIAGIVIVAVVLGAGVGAYRFVEPKVAAIAAKFSGKQESDDWTGDGTSKVTITIKQGDIGQDVAATLQRSGVVKTSSAFYKLLLSSPEVSFQPGSYSLRKHMSSQAALAALQDKANKTDASIVIPEGTALADIEAGMVSKAGLSKAEVEAAADDVSAYGLPADAKSLEGWLFPATYPINPGWTAKQYFQSMVDTMKQHLTDAGVAEADQEHVVTFASLVQKEAGLAADFPKVARVFQNRIDQGMPLQSDATVAYGTGNTHRVTTTDAERADASNPYNTYQHQGLPPAPISNPGDVAINAVAHPADGQWLYFVTVNLETGETVFSNTYAEHLKAVDQFQAWLRAHPPYQ